MEQATLIVHRGATRVTREDLAMIEPPAATATWKPIKHADVVDCLYEEFDRRHIGVTKEDYAVQRKGQYLFGVMTLNYLPTEEFAAALAFRHSNDMQEAMKMYAGVRVFACDNMALSGSELILHKKHSKNFRIADALPDALDRYQEGALTLQREIEALQQVPVDQVRFKDYVYDIFRKKVVPIRLFHAVTDEWHAQVPERDGIGTEWLLHNCFTSHLKTLAPNPAMRATVRLGRFFGLGKHVAVAHGAL